MASRSAVSPSSSPRLPSPPPMAEDQTGPQSPRMAGPDDQLGRGAAPVDHAASRRIRPGTKAVDMAEGPPLVDLADIDSPFQLTEHLKSLHYSYTHLSSPAERTPLTKHHATLLSQAPAGTDRSLWLYELCRFLVQKVNAVIVALFADTPSCSAQTCPEMRASEWQYLCAVHDPPKACCAIDYCCHTLDWAANTLTSPKHFPSRLSLGTENTAPQHQVRQLTHIFRRVYRIFAHAWFSHREMFWRVEGRTGLYIFFKTVCDVYNLIPEDNYTLPPEAEGGEAPDEMSTTSQSSQPPSILKRAVDGDKPNEAEAEDHLSSPTNPSTAGATARRHRQTPSRGAAVATVMEENEEEEEDEGPPPVPSIPPQLQQSTSPSIATPFTLRDAAEDDGGAEESPSEPTSAFVFEPPPPSFPDSSPQSEVSTVMPEPEASTPPAVDISQEGHNAFDEDVVAYFDATIAPPSFDTGVEMLSLTPADNDSPVHEPGSATKSMSFLHYSPASPKASTFEEVEQTNEDEAQLTTIGAPAESADSTRASKE